MNFPACPSLPEPEMGNKRNLRYSNQHHIFNKKRNKRRPKSISNLSLPSHGTPDPPAPYVPNGTSLICQCPEQQPCTWLTVESPTPAHTPDNIAVPPKSDSEALWQNPLPRFPQKCPSQTSTAFSQEGNLSQRQTTGCEQPHSH